MYLDFCFLLKHSCTNMWLCWEYMEKRKTGTKHFVLGTAWLQLPQTSEPVAPISFQLCPSSCFGHFTWACVVPSVSSFTVLGTCRIPLPGTGLMSICVGWGNVPQVTAQSHEVWGVWDGYRTLGRAAQGSRNPRDCCSLEEASLLLPHSPGGRQRLEHINLTVTHK